MTLLRIFVVLQKSFASVFPIYKIKGLIPMVSKTVNVVAQDSNLSSQETEAGRSWV